MVSEVCNGVQGRQMARKGFALAPGKEVLGKGQAERAVSMVAVRDAVAAASCEVRTRNAPAGTVARPLRQPCSVCVVRRPCGTCCAYACHAAALRARDGAAALPRGRGC